MTGDTFIESFRSLVRRVLTDADFIDFRARYAGRVIAQNGQLVDVAFDDAERLKTKTNVPLAALPGREVQVRPGTRVTVGWIGGDESKPRAYLEWDGEGGFSTVADQATESWTWTTPRATFSDALQAAHLHNGTAVSATNVVVGNGLGAGGLVDSVSGGDIMCTVAVKAGTMATPGILFTHTFARPFKNAAGVLTAPEVQLTDVDSAGATVLALTPVNIVVGTTDSLVSGNTYKIKLFLCGG